MTDSSDAGQRRRIVYALKAGKLQELAGGIQEFEASLEKRIDKLFADG
jgi:hypothetical protein